MRTLFTLFTAAVLSIGLFTGLGCAGNAPMDPADEAKLVQDQNAAMERNHALHKETKAGAHKTARRSSSSASPEAQYKAD